MTADSTTRHTGSLPCAHPLAQRLLADNSKVVEKYSTIPLHARHYIANAFEDEVTASQALDSSGDVWLAWVDALPPAAHGAAASRGYLMTAAYWQVEGDPNPGHTRWMLYKTARRHVGRLSDGSTLDVPVWRLNRPDRPHPVVCTDACAQCGTGAYWDLPEFVWPAPAIGLSDPNDHNRINPAEKVLWALGAKPGKVVLTDHALFEHGWTGRPETRRRGFIKRWIEGEDHDSLVVKWNGKNRGESVLRPHEVRRPDPLPQL